MSPVTFRSRAVAAVTTLALTATALLAAPAATASTPDRFLYPQSGHIYFDPTVSAVLAATPAGDVAGAGADLVLSTAGPATTVAVLNTVEGTVNSDLRRVAARPGSSMDLYWHIDSRGSVVSTSVFHWS